jgi:hypothetical protein
LPYYEIQSTILIINRHGKAIKNNSMLRSLSTLIRAICPIIRTEAELFSVTNRRKTDDPDNLF